MVGTGCIVFRIPFWPQRDLCSYKWMVGRRPFPFWDGSTWQVRFLRFREGSVFSDNLKVQGSPGKRSFAKISFVVNTFPPRIWLPISHPAKWVKGVIEEFEVSGLHICCFFLFFTNLSSGTYPGWPLCKLFVKEFQNHFFGFWDRWGGVCCKGLLEFSVTFAYKVLLNSCCA